MSSLAQRRACLPVSREVWWQFHYCNLNAQEVRRLTELQVSLDYLVPSQLGYRVSKESHTQKLSMEILPPIHPTIAAIVCDSSHISSLTPHTLRGRYLRGNGLRGVADLPKVTQLAKEKLKFPFIFMLPKDKGLSHFMCRYGGHWQTHSNHSETVIPVMLVTRPRVSSMPP